MSRLTDTDKQNIISLYSSHSCREIGIIMGISIQSVYNVIKESGIKKRKHIRVDYDGIRQDYKQGWTDVKFLSKKYGCCEMTIYKALCGIERIRGPHKVNQKESDIINELSEMQRTSKSTSMIAREFGVSRQYVYQIKNNLSQNG